MVWEDLGISGYIYIYVVYTICSRYLSVEEAGWGFWFEGLVQWGGRDGWNDSEVKAGWASGPVGILKDVARCDTLDLGNCCLGYGVRLWRAE